LKELKGGSTILGCDKYGECGGGDSEKIELLSEKSEGVLSPIESTLEASEIAGEGGESSNLNWEEKPGNLVPR
jgi:hypothetical protein